MIDQLEALTTTVNTTEQAIEISQCYHAPNLKYLKFGKTKKFNLKIYNVACNVERDTVMPRMEQILAGLFITCPKLTTFEINFNTTGFKYFSWKRTDIGFQLEAKRKVHEIQ